MPGKEADCLDPGLIRQAGEWLGAIHRLSAEDAIPFTSFSPWSMFGPTDDLAEDVCTLQKAVQASEANQSLWQEIYALYEKKRAFLEILWPDFPAEAVQGDFSLNNLLVDDDGSLCSIIDFHLAGNDGILCHFAGEAAFLAYEADRKDDDSEETGDLYFGAFAAGYFKNRQLHDLERDCLQDVLRIKRAFACHQVDDVLDKFNAGEIGQVDMALEKIRFCLTKTLPV
ncbi:phosphotransferase [Brevibacillus borstelensis]|uniref:phosphotransferase n=1 Tax=Brevibacillus borstelensis TaxID=45462 RepID=UPI001D0BD2A1|nr:phosphotransferase [Brevibacillus borstelensis]MCC0564873.1 phosphotransferase [Brevibacillus borstelensis]MCM3470662.1 phosphotransferase [Brevibacillus borstelensis]MCM3558995.1 phosphotransferase [Brevibacillus borstelensis]MCM3593477.1 phosphotransferase [Brevibacillus borstelensis]